MSILELDFLFAGCSIHFPFDQRRELGRLIFLYQLLDTRPRDNMISDVDALYRIRLFQIERPGCAVGQSQRGLGPP